MASWEADKLKDKYLTCVICKCLYDDPATLQCGHSYCRKCLTSFIQSEPDSIRSKVIPCSMRCESTRVPDPQKPVKTWATQIRPSLVIRNLLGEYKQMADQPNAGDVHKKRFIQCEDHTGKLQDLICEDHQKAICLRCWIDKHRHCKSVAPMKTKVDQIQPKNFDCKSKLNVAIEHHMVRIATFRSDVDTLGRIEKYTQSKIQPTFKKIVAVVKEKESALLKKLKTSIKSEIQTRQNIIHSEESKLQMHLQRSRLIEQTEKSGLLSDMSLAASDGKIDISQSSYRAAKDVVYSVNTDQLMESINKLDFGTLDIKYDTNTVVNDSPISSPSAACCSSSDVRSVPTDSGDQLTNITEANPRQKGCSVKQELFRIPVLADIVQCERSDDPRDPELYDVTVLDVDGIQVIVVTDQDNNCVKSFYSSKNKTCHSKLHLDYSPRGVTQLKKDQVMVAVPLSNRFMRIAVTPDLMLLSTISTNKGYHSVVALGPSRLAADSELSYCVEHGGSGDEVSIYTQQCETVFQALVYVC